MTTVEFGSLFDFIRNGMNVKQDKSGNGLPVTRIETISNAIVDATRVGYAGLGESDCSDWLLKSGDILFSHINSVEHIGKCAVYHGKPDKLVHGMNLLCLRSDATKIAPSYARYLIRSNHFRSRLSNSIKKAVNQASVSIRDLKAIPVALPSLEEQRRIAAILDQADALRAKRRVALARLDEMAQAIFVEMFGPSPYSETVALRECVEDFRYGTSEKSADNGRPTLRIPNVISGNINLNDLKFVPIGDAEFQRLSLRPGDVLFVRTNGSPDYVGRCAYIQSDLGADHQFCPFDFAYASYLVRARLKAELLDPVFLCAFLSMEAGRKQIRERAKTSAGQFNINTEGLGSLCIPRATTTAQAKFRKQTESLSMVRKIHHQHTAALDHLFTSLQHRAFTGAL